MRSLFNILIGVIVVRAVVVCAVIRAVVVCAIIRAVVVGAVIGAVVIGAFIRAVVIRARQVRLARFRDVTAAAVCSVKVLARLRHVVASSIGAIEILAWLWDVATAAVCSVKVMARLRHVVASSIGAIKILAWLRDSTVVDVGFRTIAVIDNARVDICIVLIDDLGPVASIIDACPAINVVVVNSGVEVCDRDIGIDLDYVGGFYPSINTK